MLPATSEGPLIPTMVKDSSPEDDVAPYTNVKPYLVRGLIVVVVAIGGLGGWAATAPLDSAALASGSIIVDGGRQKIQHPIGGVVLDMLVRDGQRVEAGDILLKLDPTSAETSRTIVEGTFVGAAAEEARLLAELRGDADITFPDILTAKADEPEIKRIFDVQRDLFTSRASLRRDRIKVAETQIEQLTNEKAALSAELGSARRQLALIEEELAGQRQLFEKGLALKPRVLELERSLESLEGDALSIEARAAGVDSRISEIKSQMAVERSDIHEQLVKDLRQVQLSLLQAREELTEADYILKQIDVRSPVSGLVVNNNVATEGGVVAPGELIMEIVPDLEDLVIEARVSVQDVDSIKIGQQTNVMLTAFNQATTPALEGEVVHVGADRQINLTNDTPYFQVEITIPDQELERLEDSQLLKPGMPAEVVIVTGERTVLQYLLEPITRSLAQSWREG